MSYSAIWLVELLAVYHRSYTASSEKQDGGPKTTKELNICCEKDNSTRKRLAKYIYYIEISLNTSLKKKLIPKNSEIDTFIENINCWETFATKNKWICSQQGHTILPNICIIYLSFSVRYTASKTISFTSSCKTKTFQIFKAKRFLAE
jgi:hypothetical protein